MKDINDLILQFDDLQDLPVSEELIGAYLEHTLTGSDLELVENFYRADDRFGELLSSISVSDEDPRLDDWPSDIEDIANNLNELNTEFMALNQSLEDSHGAAAARKFWGEEGLGSDPNPDLLIYQGNEGVCAIRSQQIILRDYGLDISLEQLKEYAIEQGWYDPSDGGGTPLPYVGALMQACGVDVRQQADCTIYDLVNELAQGHRVIVGVDADELWAKRENDIFSQTKEFFKDIIHEEANHALIVAGVEVNPQDPKDVKVILTDPGTGDLRIEYDLDTFMDAWEDSKCFMTTTTTPAPYQYDALHGRMVPSNFAVENFIDSNSLPLQPDILIEYPDLSLAELNDNAAYADGHLDTVGHIDGHEVNYEAFAAAHKAASNLGAMGGFGTFGQDHFDKEAFVSTLRKWFHLDATNPSSDTPGINQSTDPEQPEGPSDNDWHNEDDDDEDEKPGLDDDQDPASSWM